MKEKLKGMSTVKIRELMIDAELELLSRPDENLTRQEFTMELRGEVNRTIKEYGLLPSEAYRKVLNEWAEK